MSVINRRLTGASLLLATPAIAAAMFTSTSLPETAAAEGVGQVNLANSVGAPLPLRPNDGNQTDPGTTAEDEWSRIPGGVSGPVGRLDGGTRVWDIGAYDDCMRETVRNTDLCCVESGGDIGPEKGSCTAPPATPVTNTPKPSPKPKPRGQQG